MKALPLTLLFLSGAALADDAILKCRALADAGPRLTCYDAIDVSARPALAPAVRSKEAEFGLRPAPAPKREQEPTSVSSTIAGTIDGWRPGTQIRLANGQVWRILDGGEVVLTPMVNPKATIERGMLGGLFLKVEGTNNSARVSRVK